MPQKFPTWLLVASFAAGMATMALIQTIRPPARKVATAPMRDPWIDAEILRKADAEQRGMEDRLHEVDPVAAESIRRESDAIQRELHERRGN